MFNVYRNGKVHVSEMLCRSCIFRPGNPMMLVEGRVEGMVAEATKGESAIICHSTLDKDNQSVCRGFYDRHPTLPLQLADRLGMIEFSTAESLT